MVNNFGVKKLFDTLMEVMAPLLEVIQMCTLMKF